MTETNFLLTGTLINLVCFKLLLYTCVEDLKEILIIASSWWQDFCYYANAIFLIMLLMYPQNEKLFMVCFSFSEVSDLYVLMSLQDLVSHLFFISLIYYQLTIQGPLAWAIIVWRCSLVFNSIDKITSVLVHLLPGKLRISTSSCFFLFLKSCGMIQNFNRLKNYLHSRACALTRSILAS